MLWVNWQTAFTELEMMGVPIDPEYKKRVLQSEEASLAAKRRKKAEREAELREQLGTVKMNISPLLSGTPVAVFLTD